MCKIPKVVIVAPPEKHQELRRALSSLDYDIAATVAAADDALSIRSDAAVLWEPPGVDVQRLQAAGFKTVAVGGDGSSADMSLEPDEVASFKTRIWELFRPA
jgi:hypothetical protein